MSRVSAIRPSRRSCRAISACRRFSYCCSRQAFRNLDQSRLRRLGRRFSPSLFMGATIGGAFGSLVTAIHPIDGFGVTTCAIIGMAAMVGGGTGAA